LRGVGDKRLSPDAHAMLRDYHFPGNVRELKHIIERAAYRDTSHELEPEDIGELPGPTDRKHAGSFKERIETLERDLIAEALATARGNQHEAANALGLAYHQLRYYRKKYRL
jgi:transcriptional regulator with PAS, ATPase and Fis domain